MSERLDPPTPSSPQPDFLDRVFSRRAFLGTSLALTTVALLRANFVGRHIDKELLKLDDKELEEELSHLFVIGEQFPTEVVVAGRDDLERGVPPFITTPTKDRELSQKHWRFLLGLVRQVTGLPVIGYNRPGKGLTADLTAGQIKNIEHGGGLSPVMRPIMQNLKLFHDPISDSDIELTDIHLGGISLGSALSAAAMEVAPDPDVDLNVLTTVVGSLIGLKRTTKRELAVDAVAESGTNEDQMPEGLKMFIAIGMYVLAKAEDPQLIHLADGVGQGFVPYALDRGLQKNPNTRLVMAIESNTSYFTPKEASELTTFLEERHPGRVFVEPYVGGHGHFSKDPWSELLGKYIGIGGIRG